MIHQESGGRGRNISEAESPQDLFEILDNIAYVLGSDGSMHSAEGLKKRISRILDDAEKGKAIMIEMPTEELGTKVKTLVADARKRRQDAKK